MKWEWKNREGRSYMAHRRDGEVLAELHYEFPSTGDKYRLIIFGNIEYGNTWKSMDDARHWLEAVNGLRERIAEADRLLQSEFGGFYESAPSNEPLGRARDMLRNCIE
jgi:hypothetical protein